jgi:hypothetical protein
MVSGDPDRELYLGSDRGLVIGPYAAGEIRARLRGDAWLRSQGGQILYSIRALTLADARARLKTVREGRS